MTEGLVSAKYPTTEDENNKQTELDKLVPGINLSLLSSTEKIKHIQQEARSSETGSTFIGRAQGDTRALHNFMEFLFAWELKKDGEEPWNSRNEDRRFHLIKERFTNQIIVEIGSGKSMDGYNLANLVGARAYVAVDPFYARDVRDNLEERAEADRSQSTHPFLFPYLTWGIPDTIRNNETFKKNNVQWNTVEEDALAFLRALPDSSVSVIMSGISETVIPQEHLEQILKEISRTLSPNGALLAVNSADVYNSPNKLKVGWSLVSFKPEAILYVKDTPH